MNSQILITGAGGFIGSHLTEALLYNGFQVRAMVHYNFRGHWGWLEETAKQVRVDDPRKTDLGVIFGNNSGGALEIISGDIQDPFFTDAAVKGCEVVFHLAALIAIPYSYAAPASYVATNVIGTLNVLEACRKHCVRRLVHTSTSEVYGTAQYTPIDENHPIIGQSPYSASKIGADQLAISYNRSFGLPVSVIRPFNTFGPRQSARAVIPTIITQILAGSESIKLGSLTPVRDLNYVKDTVQGFIRVAGSDQTVGKVTNIGRGEGIAIGDLVRMILDIYGSDIPIQTDEERIRPENSEVFELVCDGRKAFQRTGWTPLHSLRQGLEETVEWFKSHADRYKPDIYNV